MFVFRLIGIGIRHGVDGRRLRLGSLAVGLALERRLLLMASDESDTEFPEPDVAPDEQHEEQQCHGVMDVVGDHQQPVEEAMDQSGDEQTQQQVAEPSLVAEFGQREEITHEDGEEEMPRHRKQRADDARGKAGSEVGAGSLQHIHDVLDAGEAETHESGIDDAVHVLVEVAVPPDKQEQERKLAELLAKARFKESRIEHTLGIVDRVGEGDERQVDRDGDHTRQKGKEEQAKGLFLVFVLTIDEDQQQDDGEQRKGDQQEGHGQNGFVAGLLVKNLGKNNKSWFPYAEKRYFCKKLVSCRK